MFYSFLFVKLRNLLVILILILLFTSCIGSYTAEKQANWNEKKFLNEYPIFSFADNSFILNSGNYRVDDNIIVPRGFVLKIEAGARLEMGKKVSIISYSPVEILGTQDQPVFIIAQDKNKPWGVFAIQGVQKRSMIQYTKFENGGEAFVNDINYTGMLAAYYSDIDVNNCIFERAVGDDALNIKESKARIANNYFYKNKSDAIDLDNGVEGEVDSNYFVSNGDEGIDLAVVSNLIIKNNYVRESVGLCLNIDGMSKNVVIFNNLFRDCLSGIGLADNSQIEIINNTIIGNKSGIIVSAGELILEKALVAVYNTIIWGNGQSIVLEGNPSIQVFNSCVEDSWSGDPPDFDDNYLSQLRGGDKEMVKEILGASDQEVNLGIISPAWSKIPF